MIWVETDDGKVIQWELGQSNRPWESGKVTAVEADEIELDWIRSTFTGIPDRPTNKMVMWRGDDAKFIAEHIKPCDGELWVK